jgi:hypothetical protein
MSFSGTIRHRGVGDVRERHDGVHDRDIGYRIFFGFTAVLWFGCVVLGIVMGLATKSGTGIGDTHLVEIAHKAMPSGSFVGETWRILISFAALAALPVGWYWFLQHLGDFGFGGQKVAAADEVGQVLALQQDELRHPVAAAVAYRISLFSVGFLLLFGNFFLPYVVIRWGWGGA